MTIADAISPTAAGLVTGYSVAYAGIKPKKQSARTARGACDSWRTPLGSRARTSNLANAVNFLAFLERARWR